MTIQKAQDDSTTENASEIAEKFTVLGSMGTVRESSTFDEFMGFIDRGEIQPYGKEALQN